MATLQPPRLGRATPPVLHYLSEEAIAREMTAWGNGAFGSDAAWPNANTAILYPIHMDEPTVVTKLWWTNGSTISTPGSVDVGIWDESGNLLVSAGSTTPSGVSQFQYVDVTDYTLVRGRYYLGMTASVANAANYTVTRVSPAAGLLEASGCFEITSAAPALSTSANPATFAVTTRAYLPLCGALTARALGS